MYHSQYTQFKGRKGNSKGPTAPNSHISLDLTQSNCSHLPKLMKRMTITTPELTDQYLLYKIEMRVQPLFTICLLPPPPPCMQRILWNCIFSLYRFYNRERKSYPNFGKQRTFCSCSFSLPGGITAPIGEGNMSTPIRFIRRTFCLYHMFTHRLFGSLQLGETNRENLCRSCYTTKTTHFM